MQSKFNKCEELSELIEIQHIIPYYKVVSEVVYLRAGITALIPWISSCSLCGKHTESLKALSEITDAHSWNTLFGVTKLR